MRVKCSRPACKNLLTQAQMTIAESRGRVPGTDDLYCGPYCRVKQKNERAKKRKKAKKK